MNGDELKDSKGNCVTKQANSQYTHIYQAITVLPLTLSYQLVT